MKVEKKDLEKAQVELTVELSQEEFAPYLEKGVQKISKEILDEEFPNKNNKVGRILSGDQFIASSEKLEMLVKIFKGDCVEMESAAVAQVCYILGTDFVVLRLISDKANSEAKIDFSNFIREAVSDFTIYIKKLIKRI
jgi:adenosylhomocysteine nucleosidase